MSVCPPHRIPGYAEAGKSPEALEAFKNTPCTGCGLSLNEMQAQNAAELERNLQAGLDARGRWLLFWGRNPEDRPEFAIADLRSVRERAEATGAVAFELPDEMLRIWAKGLPEEAVA